MCRLCNVDVEERPSSRPLPLFENGPASPFAKPRPFFDQITRMDPCDRQMLKKTHDDYYIWKKAKKSFTTMTPILILISLCPLENKYEPTFCVDETYLIIVFHIFLYYSAEI